MKILVTGSSGYFGKPLTDKLSQNYEISEYDIVNGKNILNYEQLKDAMKGSEIVIHSAAIPKPDESKTFNDYFEINCKGTLNVVNAAIENKVKRFRSQALHFKSFAFRYIGTILLSSLSGNFKGIPLSAP